jgi:hypothetical protein
VDKDPVNAAGNGKVTKAPHRTEVRKDLHPGSWTRPGAAFQTKGWLAIKNGTVGARRDMNGVCDQFVGNGSIAAAH